MLSIGINLLGQVAKTAVVSAVSKKVVDSLITTKLNKKSDHNKWLRETKLNLFTQLSNEILSYDLENASANEEKKLKEICTKTIILLDDKSIIYKIEDFINKLNKTQRDLIFKDNKKDLILDFKNSSMNLVISLNQNLKKS